MFGGLGDLFGPEGGEQFLHDVLGRAAVYTQGSPDKFRELISWGTVNRLLTFGRLGFPRVRLIKENRELPASSYSYMGANGFPRLLVSELIDLLRGGATLAIDSIEQLHEPVSVLCQTLEKKIQLAVEADLYCACEGAAIGDIARDEHENIVLQVEGRKRWQLYRPGGSCTGNRGHCGEAAEGPAWEGALCAGDLLYVPRGWWYRDGPMEEASLYLVVTFRNPTGKDAVQRALSGLNSPIMETDLPRLGSFESPVLAQVQKEVSERCAEPGLVLGLLKDLRRTAEPRICFDLPRTGCCFPVPEEYVVLPLVRFPGGDTVKHLAGDDAVEVFHTGRWIRFHEEVVEILEQLSHTPVQSVRTLIAACNGGISRTRAMEHLAELARHGMVVLRASREGETAEAALGVS